MIDKVDIFMVSVIALHMLYGLVLMVVFVVLMTKKYKNSKHGGRLINEWVIVRLTEHPEDLVELGFREEVAKYLAGKKVRAMQDLGGVRYCSVYIPCYMYDEEKK